MLLCYCPLPDWLCSEAELRRQIEEKVKQEAKQEADARVRQAEMKAEAKAVADKKALADENAKLNAKSIFLDSIAGVYVCVVLFSLLLIVACSD